MQYVFEYKGKRLRFTLESTISIAGGDFQPTVTYGIEPVKKDKDIHSKNKKRRNKKDNAVDSDEITFSVRKRRKKSNKNIREADDNELVEKGTLHLNSNVDMITIADLRDLLSDLIEQFRYIYRYLPASIDESQIISDTDYSILFDKHIVYNRIRRLTRFKEHITVNFDDDYLINKRELLDFFESIQEDVEILAEMLAILNITSSEAQKRINRILKSFSLNLVAKSTPSFIV